MLECPDPGVLVEEEVDRILTQYRESPKLLHVIRTRLKLIEEVILATCSIPSHFDIMTAVGDQLTLIGKRMGWPRCHCVCAIQPVFGFQCDGFQSGYTLVGFCDPNGDWVDCGPFGTSEICITDDEVYRGFLLARRYQMLALFDLDSLTAAIRHLFGPTANVIDAGAGRVVIAPGRVLTPAEEALLQLYPRVLPVAPGIRVRFHFGLRPVFGFGAGWAGFCEEWQPVGLPVVTETGKIVIVPAEDTGDPDKVLITGPLTRDADWLCEVDVHPYDCS